MDDDTRRLAAKRLGEINPGNQKAIDALVELSGNSQVDDDTRRLAAKSLGEINPGNQKVIDALVELIGNSQVDNSTRRLAAKSLEEIMAEEQMASVVTALKNYLSHETYENDFQQLYNCYSLIWKCAQKMSYPAFHQAWHQEYNALPSFW